MINCAFLLNLIQVSVLVLLVNGRSINGNQGETDDPRGELLQLHYIFRHGQRTPLGSYATDPHKHYPYPEGAGGLTSKGVELLYRFGTLLRSRYAPFLQTVRLPAELHSQSSPTHRAVLSNYALLSGLFPPSPEQIWCNNTPLAKLWQPLAVKMESTGKAYVIGESGPCPVASKIFATILDLAPIQDMEEANRPLLSKLTELTGQEMNSFVAAVGLYDTLTCQRDYGLALPAWADETLLSALKPFRDLGFAITAQLPAPFLRLKAGPFYKELLSNFKLTSTLKTKEASHKKKVFLYSTHDTVLGNILNGLLGEFKEQTNYGSGLLFELRSLPSADSPLVYLYFANVTDNGAIYQLPLNGSPTFSSRCREKFCSLDNFTASLEESLIPIDIERECGAKLANRQIPGFTGFLI